jgi:ATP-dependent DNA helicase RecG
VIRGNHQAYCFLCTHTVSPKSLERLQALKNAKNGFDLAELDLKMRGAGELYGDSQWGITDIGMEAIKNIKLVEAAKQAAGVVMDSGPLPVWIEERTQIKDDLHME